MDRIYLDYAATTPIDKEAVRVMKPYFDSLAIGKFGNPNSLHFFGQESRGAIDKAREIIVQSLGLNSFENFREIIFTGSATEANNLALRGVVKKIKNQKNKNNVSKIRIIVSAIEHESVLDTVKDLEKEGIEVVYLPVNKNGIVDLKKLKENLNDMTALVSVMLVNNETGAIQPIKEISKIISDFKKEKTQRQILSYYPLLHTDAVQAFQFNKCSVNDLGVDLMTLSGHKIYGPKGIGVLYVKKQNVLDKSRDVGQVLEPIITGGGQEFGLRSGTENVPYIAGLGKAIELAERDREKNSKETKFLRDYFWNKLKTIYSQVKLNNDFEKNKNLFSPHILNVSFDGYNSNDLLVGFDLEGVAVSAGSACAANLARLSYVLKAMGLHDKEISSSLRFSLGKYTTKQEIDEAVKRIKKVLKNLKK